MVRTNARGEVIVPLFRAGVSEYDIAALLAALKR